MSQPDKEKCVTSPSLPANHCLNLELQKNSNKRGHIACPHHAYSECSYPNKGKRKGHGYLMTIMQPCHSFWWIGGVWIWHSKMSHVTRHHLMNIEFDKVDAGQRIVMTLSKDVQAATSPIDHHGSVTCESNDFQLATWRHICKYFWIII